MTAKIPTNANYNATSGVELVTEVEQLPNGNIAIVDGGYWTGEGSEVIVVDRKGNIVWSYEGGLLFAHTVKLLPNGNFVIVDTGNDRLLKVNRDGEVVWECTELADGSSLWYPNDVFLLEDGHMMVSDRNNNRIVEIDRERNIHWSYTDLKHSHNVHVRENGNVLFANSDANEVVEVDREGNRVWSYGDGSPDTLDWPRDVDPLENGNYLVADSKNDRVLEVTSEGEVVWDYTTKRRSQPYEADRLSNGHTLIPLQRQYKIQEVDRFGNVVWMWRNFTYHDEVTEDISNPGFEEIRSGENSPCPEDWLPCILNGEGGGEFYLDDEISFEGDNSVRLEYDREGIIWLQQTVGVREGTRYLLEGAIKGEDIEGVAQMQMAFKDKEGIFIHDLRDLSGGSPFSGTFDWRKDETEFEAPENATAVDIRLMISGEGTVWFDDINFQEVPWG